MTCISYDGKIIAADRLATLNGIKNSVEKIRNYETDKKIFYFGGAGCDFVVKRLITYWMNKEEKGFPDLKEREESELLIIEIVKNKPVTITPPNFNLRSLWTKKVFVLNSLDFGDFADLTDEPFWAIGCGAKYALGAMASGKSAKESVEIASLFCVDVGDQIDSMITEV
jgi:ATP-dependent protease HslVU (ClpYQ) peptidase subunit